MLVLKIKIKGNIDKEGCQEIYTHVYENVYSFSRDEVNTCIVYGPPNELVRNRKVSIWENDRVLCFELKEKEENKNAETS